MSGDALERAGRLLSQAVSIEGETPPLLALMAWTSVTQVRLGIHRGVAPLEEAETQAHALLARAPDSPNGHALLGYIEYERGHLPEAVGHFQRALEREPNDADALFYMGISYIAAGQNELALATGQRIVVSDPLASLSWMLSGATRWFVGRFAEALPDLTRGLELDPRLRPSLDRRLHLRRSRPDERGRAARVTPPRGRARRALHTAAPGAHRRARRQEGGGS